MKTLLGIGAHLFCNIKDRKVSKEATYNLVKNITCKKFFVNLNAVLDNLKCLDEVSSQKNDDEAVGAGPPISFLPAGFKIKAPCSRFIDMGGNNSIS